MFSVNTHMEKEQKNTLVDHIRLWVLTSAELFDAWRVVPRLLVTAYGWLCWEIVSWYMRLTPSIIEGCDIDKLAELCLYDAPTTQHAALVTVIVGASAAVFGLYTNTGRSWVKGGFVKWDQTNMQRTSEDQYTPRPRRYEDGRDDKYGRYEPQRNNSDEEGFWEDAQR